MNKPNRATAMAIIGPLPGSGPYKAIHVLGEITDTMAERMCSDLSAARRASTLAIFVNSIGGDISAAERIYRAVRAHGAKRKLAYAYGDLASAAVLAFSAADARRVWPGTRVLLHGAAQEPGASHRWTAATYENNAANLRRLDARIARTLAERCGVPANVISAKMRNEAETPLIEALSCGLIHEVIGESAPLLKSWPENMRAVVNSGRSMQAGALEYLTRPQFLEACKIGGR